MYFRHSLSSLRVTSRNSGGVSRRKRGAGDSSGAHRNARALPKPRGARQYVIGQAGGESERSARASQCDSIFASCP